jgi:hypothetical protein
MTFWVAGAVVVGGIASSAIGASAAGDAANAQAGAAQNAQNISQSQFNTIQAQNAPFIQSGYGALSALDYGLGIGPQTANGAPVQAGGQATGSNGVDPSSGYGIGPGGSISQLIAGGGAPASSPASPYGSVGSNGISLGQTVNQPNATGTQGMPAQSGGASTGVGTPGQTGGLGYGSLTAPFTTANWQQLSPAYNFQRQQGTQGVLNADAAGAGALSGSANKDLIDYNQNAANTSFNNAFNQYQTQQGNIFSRLSGIAGLGQNSANNTGAQGTALAGQAAQSATNIGTAQAGGIVGSANAISGGISSAAPWLSQFAGGGSSSDLTVPGSGVSTGGTISGGQYWPT